MKPEDQFKGVLKSVLRQEIQFLLQRLAEAGEETCVLGANVEDNLYYHLGSGLGQSFAHKMQSVLKVKRNFLSYCKETFMLHNYSVDGSLEVDTDDTSTETRLGHSGNLKSKCMKHPPLSRSPVNHRTGQFTHQLHRREKRNMVPSVSESSHSPSILRTQPSDLIFSANLSSTPKTRPEQSNFQTRSVDSKTNSVFCDTNMHITSDNQEASIMYATSQQSPVTEEHVSSSNRKRICNLISDVPNLCKKKRKEVSRNADFETGEEDDINVDTDKEIKAVDRLQDSGVESGEVSGEKNVFDCQLVLQYDGNEINCSPVNCQNSDVCKSSFESDGSSNICKGIKRSKSGNTKCYVQTLDLSCTDLSSDGSVSLQVYDSDTSCFRRNSIRNDNNIEGNRGIHSSGSPSPKQRKFSDTLSATGSVSESMHTPGQIKKEQIDNDLGSFFSVDDTDSGKTHDLSADKWDPELVKTKFKPVSYLNHDLKGKFPYSYSGHSPFFRERHGLRQYDEIPPREECFVMLDNNPAFRVCKLCNKIVRASSSRFHWFAHSGVKPFKCEYCGKMFNNKCNLTTHKLVHTGEKPFSCDICGQLFTTNGNMRRHRQKHDGLLT